MDISNKIKTLNKSENSKNKVIQEVPFNNQKIFSSFWMAGYECSDQMNAFGNRVNLLKATVHDQMIYEDYQSLSAFNMKTVREGVQWSEVEKRPFTYDWSWLEKAINAAKKTGIQIIWDLCHFGFPSDLTPLHPKFPLRFMSFAEAFAKKFKQLSPDETLIVVPINEVSFISWLGGDVKGTVPYTLNHGWEVKYAMMNAYIQGIKKLKEVDSRTLILSTEPLIHVTSNDENMHLKGQALQDTLNQFQVSDILQGKICPELGGNKSFPDIIGVNYYYNNQWQLPDHARLDWKDQTCTQKVPLHKLLRKVYERYRKPILLSETSHFLEDRDIWIEMIAKECKIAIDEGIPLLGICIYPILDRPDWDDIHLWHRSGLWEIFNVSGSLKRVLNTPYAKAILKSQLYIKE